MKIIKTNYRILIAEGDESTGWLEENLVNQVLKDRKLTGSVDLVCDGHTAIEKVRQDPNYDLLILDGLMSELTGPETYSQIKAEHPELAKKIFLCSVEPSLFKEFVQKEQVECLARPFKSNAYFQDKVWEYLLKCQNFPSSL